jgi:integral membrane protein
MTSTNKSPIPAVAIPAFRFFAHIEAVSWVGLLLGMYFKYLVPTQFGLGESLVSSFGRIHGLLVMVYIGLAFAVSSRLAWRMKTTLIALACVVPPFATVIFDWWANRTGQYREAQADDMARS